GEHNAVFSAFGDYDSDKFTDVFVVSENGKSLKALRGQKATPFLFEENQWSCDLTDPKLFIVGVILGDFRGKASMDIVLVTRDELGNEQRFALYLIHGNKSNLNCSHLKEKPFAIVKHHPLSLDINGDMIVDLFAEAADDSKRYFWLGQTDGHFRQIEFGSDLNNPIKNPNSNAFIDLNSDSIPDLFISGEHYLEYWFSPSQNSSNSTSLKIQFPETKYKTFKHGESSFFDIDSDGTIDHLMPACDDHKCLLLVWRTPSWVMIAELFQNFDNSSAPLLFVTERKFGPFVFPLKLRHADVDGDGFPDLIALMTSLRLQRPLVVILQNVFSSNSFGRTFVPRWNIRPDLTENNHAVVATFFDLKEDGRPDVLIAYKNDEKDTRFKIASDFNTQMTDACFLKVLVTSGLCYGHCPPEQSSPMDPASNTIPYGTNQAGPLIIYESVDTEGYKRRGAAGQLSQSADFSLQMPYTIFGLGQQPNFVDNLTASIPSGTQAPRYQSWPQIIPDSQVVVIPYPPNDPRQWRHKLFITPSDIVISTLITLTSICCLLVLIIAVLHRKEVLEDLAEHEEYKRHWPECK
ncbi:T-cell immunomodulatory protein-like protein, partial [Dinothrombium tinctorium]